MPYNPPSTNEDEYFAREDALNKAKLAKEQAKSLKKKEREELKALHFMKCPKCGMDLQEVKYGKLTIDRCFNCGATVLDQGELEQIAKHTEKEGTYMRTVLNIFKTK